MDLNGPGTSLFQGNDLHNYDNLEQREEEQEALEEQKRRDLELKNMLENAFDDVSFDNDDGSLCNGSENQSTFHNSFHPELDHNAVKDSALNRGLKDFDNNLSNHHIDNFNTPLKHSKKNNQVKRVDFSNDHENFSDQCRKQMQNGSLHDIVDASGGGDDIHSPSHYKHCFKKSSIGGEAIYNGVSSNTGANGLISNYTDTAEDSSEQLKILYDVRVREVHRLTELIDSMKNEHEIELNGLKHQLALMMAEKERANISQAQLQSLLVECKQQVEQLANDVNSLEQANKELETCKRELMMEFETAKLTIDDLQRKVIVLEKGSKSKSEAVQYELNLRSLTEKHNLELLNVKKELDNYMRNYESVVKENEELKLKISRLTQINDENLAKKSEIINRLSQQIDESQRQYENLMKLSTTEDNFRLQTEIKIIKEEKSQLVSKIENLEKENSRQEEELKQYESLSRISLLNDSKEFEGSEMNGKLGAELYRALSGQKAKRLEIKNLQGQLNEKNEKIAAMIEREKILSNEIAKLKDEAKGYLLTIKNNEQAISLKHEEHLAKLQRRIDELIKELKITENNLKIKIEELEEENELLRNKVTSLENEKTEAMSNYSEEYMRFHNEGLDRVREETEKHFKLEVLKKDLEIENLKKEVDEIKNLYVEVYNSKENLISQLEKERNSERSSAVDLEEVKRLQKELDKSRHRILELDQTLKQQYQQEVEILNLDINQLNLQIEKLKKEKDREVSEKDKISVENELLKTEIEQVTSEKNLLYLDYEKLQKNVEDLHKDIQKLRETSEYELKELIEKHSLEIENLSNKYEVAITTLKKEMDLFSAKSVKVESKYTSPMKNTSTSGTRNVATQESLVAVDKSTSPLSNSALRDIASPTSSGIKKGIGKMTTKESRFLKDISVLTDPEPVKIPKKEVVAIMEKLGAHHEEEMKILENKYRAELSKLDKKFQVEVDKAKEIIRRELKKEYAVELERLEEKHKIELENRIEQEKKEAVVDLITEWACEVQSLKTSYAESQTEMEKMKMKYKAAKNVALQYKSYFKSKAEHMKEEWKRIEDGYERALKELEKNVHILVDVKEDEVKAKVDSITKIYEEKINKMKEKLSKCEDKLRAEEESEEKKGESCRSHEKLLLKKELERLSVPDGNLNHKSGLSKKKRAVDLLSQFERLREAELQRDEAILKLNESASTSGEQKWRQPSERVTARNELSERERTTR